MCTQGSMAIPSKSITGLGTTKVGQHERRAVALYRLYSETVNHERTLSRPGTSKRSRPSSAAPTQEPIQEPPATIPAPISPPIDRRKLIVSRPTSAQLHETEKMRTQMRQQLQKPVKLWNMAEVSDWVAYIGLPQYRKRFIHQGISGSLLLRLTHNNLKVLHPFRFLCSLLVLLLSRPIFGPAFEAVDFCAHVFPSISAPRDLQGPSNITFRFERSGVRLHLASAYQSAISSFASKPTW